LTKCSHPFEYYDKFIKEKGERLKDKGFGFYSPPRRQERREIKLTADTRRFTQTAVGLLPWIIAFFFEKFLEFDCRKDYHYSVPCGPAKPTCLAGAAACLFQSAALAL